MYGEYETVGHAEEGTPSSVNKRMQQNDTQHYIQDTLTRLLRLFGVHLDSFVCATCYQSRSRNIERRAKYAGLRF